MQEKQQCNSECVDSNLNYQKHYVIQIIDLMMADLINFLKINLVRQLFVKRL